MAVGHLVSLDKTVNFHTVQILATEAVQASTGAGPKPGDNWGDLCQVGNLKTCVQTMICSVDPDHGIGQKQKKKTKNMLSCLFVFSALLTDDICHTYTHTHKIHKSLCKFEHQTFC